MKITKTILFLLLSTVMFAAYADKPKKQDPLLTGPFFIQPYFNAFGMRVQEVDTTEARRGCVDVWEHQSARAYYFVSKKNAETSMEYTTGESGFRIDNIKFHVYREYPTVEETEGFMWNEIPKDWQEISEEEFLELEKENKIKILKNQEFEEKFLEGAFLVVSATDNKELNDKISKLCMSKNILVNNITSQDNMNLRFMSILSNDDIQISITANGNPKKAVEVKNKIKEFFEKIF